jgi:2-polyprenyl-3-methyl-5-hydroxy-6-metoxy-1,4-benzoquinol methylase
MTRKKLFTVYGNCQAAALATEMLAHGAFADAYAYVPLAPCFSVPEPEIRAWTRDHEGRLDLVVAQHLWPGWRENNPAWDVATVATSLRHGGQLLRYTDIYFRGVNPLLVYPKTFARPPYCDYADLVSLTLASLGFKDAALCAALYRSPSLLQAHEIAAIRDLAELELARREVNVELRCASELAALNRRMPSFHTFNHPGNGSLSVLARKVLAHLGVANEPVNWPAHELLGTVRFPLPESMRATYPSGAPGAAAAVRLNDGKDIALEAYFETALAHLAAYGTARLREEVRRQREDTISGLVVAAVERALADRLATSTGAIAEIGRLEAQGITPEFLLSKADPQAVGFMVDILGALRATLLPRHISQRLSVLDLGAKSGAGSQLLGYLGQSGSFAKIKFDVTSADIDPTYQAYAAAKHPQVEYLNADVFEAGRQWDIVICSHVIEHIPDPLAFIARLRTIARRYIILAFPYMEDPANLIPGHLHSLGHGFLRQLAPASWEVYEGLFWGQSLCAIAVLDVGAAAA